MPSEQTWQQWLERLYNLRRDKRESHERPHKPALLLSILDLVDKGRTRNEIPLDDDLVSTFRRYFDVVRQRNDKPTIENPFFASARAWMTARTAAATSSAWTAAPSSSLPRPNSCPPLKASAGARNS